MDRVGIFCLPNRTLAEYSSFGALEVFYHLVVLHVISKLSLANLFKINIEYIVKKVKLVFRENQSIDKNQGRCNYTIQWS